MSNKRFDEINIPINIDNAIESGVAKALKEQNSKKSTKFKMLPKIVAASLVGVITLGIATPALASRIPFVGNIFEEIEKNLYFPGNYSQYATSVNETAYSNGIGITLSEVVCDGQTLYATYIVENDEPFKYTSWENGKELDMNQLIIEEKYNSLDFTNQEPDTSGFAGLQGKFIDEKTFVGVKEYDLSSIKEEIPDEFIFKTKIKVVENYAINGNDKDYIKWGTWAFNIPVKVNKDLKNEITLENIENDFIKVNSVTMTPFKTIVKATCKQGNWSDYEVRVLDENNKELNWDKMGPIGDNEKEMAVFLESIGESKSIRVIVEKGILKELSNKKGTYEEVGRELIFDKVITLDK